jgi:hypothetical protein
MFADRNSPQRCVRIDVALEGVALEGVALEGEAVSGEVMESLFL